MYMYMHAIQEEFKFSPKPTSRWSLDDYVKNYLFSCETFFLFVYNMISVYICNTVYIFAVDVQFLFRDLVNVCVLCLF